MKRFLYHFILLVVFCFCVSCGAKKDAKEGVLSQPEMVSTLIDMYVAEQKITLLRLPADSSKFLAKKMTEKVLASKNVQDSVLKKSFDYYITQPKELEEIYSALVDSLNLREQRVNSKPAGI